MRREFGIAEATITETERLGWTTRSRLLLRIILTNIDRGTMEETDYFEPRST